ncbi:MAG: glutathione S-transferase C-terminal domain-containing protein [Acidimicrobiales bacterium]
MTQHPLKLRGALGSPYSLKMRAVLRYRRIPFRWVPQGSAHDDLPPFPLIPVIGFPDADGTYGDAQMDSSPLIMRLESMTTDRSIVPVDPVVAFLDYLVEDFADEWVTKAMYHYRWYYDEAIHRAKHLLPLDRDQQLPAHHWERAQRFISERQISRRALVGSTEQNRAPIEESFLRLLGLLENLLAESPFLFGTRPSRADFGLFGQLVQLLRWDPVSVRLGIEHAPRLVNWVDRTDDLSWWDVDGNSGWLGRDSLPAPTLALLPEIGRTYAPFLLANDAALNAGDETFSCTIDGLPYSQGTFVYQRKCLAWLREQHSSLSGGDRAVVDGILAGTGCEVLFG